MIYLSVRVKSLKFIGTIICIAAILGLSFAFMGKSGAIKAINPKIITTSEQRYTFLRNCGLEAINEIEEDIIIPPVFNETFNDYNSMQIAAGYNLERFKGKTLKKYSYEIKNYPNVIENVIASVIVYKDRIVGGDISLLETDGFSHGLMPISKPNSESVQKS